MNCNKPKSPLANRVKQILDDEPTIALITLHGQTFPWMDGSKIMERDFSPFPGMENIDVHHVRGWEYSSLQSISNDYDHVVVFGYSEGGSRAPAILPRNTIGFIGYESPIRKSIHAPNDLPPSLTHVMTLWNGKGKSAKRTPLVKSTEFIWTNQSLPFYFSRRLPNNLKHATLFPPSHLIDPIFLTEILVGFLSLMQHRAMFSSSDKIARVARSFAKEFDINLTTPISTVYHTANGY